MNYQSYSIFLNILGGIIAGFIVYFIIEHRERHQWQKSKVKLIKLFDGTLNRALSTIRLLAGINPPPPLDIQKNEQFLKYIKKEFGEDCKNLSEYIINNLTPERHKTLLVNIQGLQEETKYLLSMFLTFKKADNWYVERIIELYNHIQSDFWAFCTFPEISDYKYKEDRKIKDFKYCAANNIVDFSKFVLEVKHHKNIRNNTCLNGEC
jgi:hypothetical protein